MRPKQRPPTHPGEILLKEFLEPMGSAKWNGPKHFGCRCIGSTR